MIGLKRKTSRAGGGIQPSCPRCGQAMTPESRHTGAPESSEDPVASALVRSEVLFFVPDSPVHFASGILSPVYMDVRRLLAYMAEWRVVISALVEEVERMQAEAEVVAGVAVGGIPHSSAVAALAGLPSCFVRAQAKSHGRAKDVEGAEVDGRKVVLLEDVITTGRSSLEAVETLQNAGGEVAACIAVTGYGFPEAERRFKKTGVPLQLLTTFKRMLAAAEHADAVREDAVEEARRWHSDPYNWRPAAAKAS